MLRIGWSLPIVELESKILIVYVLCETDHPPKPRSSNLPEGPLSNGLARVLWDSNIDIGMRLQWCPSRGVANAGDTSKFLRGANVGGCGSRPGGGERRRQQLDSSRAHLIAAVFETGNEPVE
ncbi:hypothetical protein NL676_007322 [Syzygium grande]|nr:hypothetical protein NL676_007322 [Syzygium grande]